MTLAFLDFFAGAGLATMGLEPHWRCVWANDIDPRKALVYRANFGAGHFCLGDVAKVTSDSIPQGAQMAWASFPCQDLSLAGWRRGMTARRSGTFWEFWRIMNEMFQADARPPVIVLENVVGLLHDDGFAGLCDALAALGLQFGALVIDAVHFLPQSRPRVFIIAVDARVDCSAFSVPWRPDEPWFPASLVSAWARLTGSPVDLWRWWSLPRPNPADVPDVLTMLETGDDVDWDAPSHTLKLLELMTDEHRQRVNDAIMSERTSVGFVYKRTRNGRQRAEVRFDGIAGCLRTPGGGSSRQTVLLVKNGVVRTRLLTPREAARLMGVSDSFELPGSYNDVYRAMGDAVAVPVVRWLSEKLLIPLADACMAKDYQMDGSYELASSIIRSQQAAHHMANEWRQNSAVREAPDEPIDGQFSGMVRERETNVG